MIQTTFFLAHILFIQQRLQMLRAQVTQCCVIDAPSIERHAKDRTNIVQTLEVPELHQSLKLSRILLLLGLTPTCMISKEHDPQEHALMWYPKFFDVGLLQ